MKPRISTSIVLAFLMVFAFIACDNKAKKDETVKTDTTKTGTTSLPDFDPSMDATKTSGYPATILGDTLNMKVYEFLAKPGDSIPVHSHPDHVLYVLEGGMADITGKDGKVQAVEFKKGSCVISGPQSHSAKNTGTTAIKLLIVHVYRPRD
ncbi:MAG TPA: cupin domain-containing protein [Chitinophagaceae bacterium]|nr:cupin domain-containing protein [Chitinophagaceae bacterium]